MTHLTDGIRILARYHFHHQKWVQETSQVVSEVAVTLFVNGREYATVALTPIDLRDWVLGFLAGEGAIESANAITVFQWNPREGQIWVRIPGFKASRGQNSRYLGSCCGQSRPGFFNPDGISPIAESHAVNIRDIQTAFSALSRWSHAQHSGGLHAAGLAHGAKLVLARADVGRHNALDKVYGASLTAPEVKKQPCEVLFTGRLSAEIIWKVRLMECPVIVSNAAPTTLGIELAERFGITAIGFARNQELSVFTHPERLVKEL